MYARMRADARADRVPRVSRAAAPPHAHQIVKVAGKKHLAYKCTICCKSRNKPNASAWRRLACTGISCEMSVLQHAPRVNVHVQAQTDPFLVDNGGPDAPWPEAPLIVRE